MSTHHLTVRTVYTFKLFGITLYRRTRPVRSTYVVGGEWA